MPEELEDALQPAHELSEEAVVVDVDFVDKLVEVVLVSSAEVDEGLYSLIRICGDVLALGSGDYENCVVGEGGEVGDGGVHVRGFVDADERFVEDGEEITKEVECYRLLAESQMSSWLRDWL